MAGRHRFGVELADLKVHAVAKQVIEKSVASKTAATTLIRSPMPIFAPVLALT
jgi:hypothetical protein